jgi:uncharacterized protein (TIGR01244 family)
MPSLKWTFAVSLLAGALAVMGAVAFARRSSDAVAAKELAGGVWVAEQVSTRQVLALKAHGFRAIVDLRPDGEAPGQPSSNEIGRMAKASGLAFTYLPVPHGDIPGPAADTLEQTLAQVERPVLLYCRSGRRAARTWALAEASRTGGLDAAAIARAVQSAGQSADDLASQITERIAARPARP